MAQRKHDPSDDPAPVGFCYNGWTFVGSEPHRQPSRLPAFFRQPLREYLFMSEGGEKMGCLFPDDGRTFTIRAAKEAVFSHLWRQEEQRLANEYARMC